MRSLVGMVLAAALAVAGPDVVSGQTPSPALRAYHNRLLGVFDNRSGEPIEGARVVDVLNRVTALTTLTGTVSLIFLPDGASIVRVEKVGYQSTTLAVEITPTDTTPVTILLKPIEVNLPAMVTKDSFVKYMSPGLQSFETRRHAGVGGNFLDEAELRKHDNDKLSNVLRRFPGLTLVCPKTGAQRGECFGATGRIMKGTAPCIVPIYFDGVPSMETDLQKLRVDEFAGVEFYQTATVPVQFNRRNTSCGVLLLWTRER